MASITFPLTLSITKDDWCAPGAKHSAVVSIGKTGNTCQRNRMRMENCEILLHFPMSVWLPFSFQHLVPTFICYSILAFCVCGLTQQMFLLCPCSEGFHHLTHTKWFTGMDFRSTRRSTCNATPCGSMSDTEPLIFSSLAFTSGDLNIEAGASASCFRAISLRVPDLLLEQMLLVLHHLLHSFLITIFN